MNKRTRIRTAGWSLIFLALVASAIYGQGRTVEIDIKNKQYVPPEMTAKIPQQFKDAGTRLAVRAGDTIKICNHDTFAAKPFSLSAGNSFEGLAGPGGLKPGACMSYVVQGHGNDPISFKLFDELHARNKLWLAVLPKNWPNEGEERSPADPRDPRDIQKESEEDSSFPDLAGSWTCITKCPAGGTGKTASISQNGQTLHFTNEGGQGSSGRFEGSTTVVATQWGNLRATIANGGRELEWSNGTVWRKQ